MIFAEVHANFGAVSLLKGSPFYVIMVGPAHKKPRRSGALLKTTHEKIFNH
jgi:hypothetical protein